MTGDLTERTTERERTRLGAAVLVDGVPRWDPDTTVSLLQGVPIGRWLASQSRVVRGRLLDLGCGNQPYRPWYAPLAGEVVTLDATVAPGVRVLAFADRLPFADRSFDTVLATEVLEHVQDAERAAAEIWRVLRPGGHVLVTVPYLYPTHEAPYDFRRFTHFGLRDLLLRHGFQVQDLAAKGGPGLLVAQWAVIAARQALGTRVEQPWVRRALTAPQQAFVRRGRVALDVSGLRAVISLGYMATARRPPED